jgi:hypothetical protein
MDELASHAGRRGRLAFRDSPGAGIAGFVGYTNCRMGHQTRAVMEGVLLTSTGSALLPSHTPVHGGRGKGLQNSRVPRRWLRTCSSVRSRSPTLKMLFGRRADRTLARAISMCARDCHSVQPEFV